MDTITCKLNNKNIILRSPLPGEGQLLLSYFQTLFHESSDYLNYPKDYYDNQSIEHQDKFIDHFNSLDDSLALFAYHEGYPVASLILKNFGYPAGRHCATLAMGVIKEWQGMGLGKAMIDRAMALCSLFGITHIELRVRTHNKPAISLYEKSGFVFVGKIPTAACTSTGIYDEYLYCWNKDES